MQSLWNQVYKYNSSNIRNDSISKICYYTSTTTTITNSSFVVKRIKHIYQNNIMYHLLRNTNKLLFGNPIMKVGTISNRCSSRTCAGGGSPLHQGTVRNINHQLFNDTKKNMLLLQYHTRTYTTDTIIDIYRRLYTQQQSQQQSQQQQYTNNSNQPLMVLIYTAFTTLCSMMLWSVTSDMTLLGNNNNNPNCISKAFSNPDDIEDDDDNNNNRNNKEVNKKHIFESVIDPLEHAISEMIDTVSTSVVSSLTNPNSSNINSNDNNNNNNDMTDLIGTISTMIQNNTENLDSKMKQFIDQILRPSNMKDDDTTKNTSSNNNEKQIVQSLFQIIMGSIAMTSKQSDTSETIDNNNNTDTNDPPTKLVVPCTNITNSVSDLIEAILQKNGTTTSNDQHNKNDTLILEPKVIEDTTSLYDLYNFLMTYHDDIQTLVTKYMSKIDYQRITPTAILYYTDYANQQYESILQEQIKNRKYISNPFIILLRNWQQEQRDKIIDFLNRNTTTSTSSTPAESTNDIDQSIIDCIEHHHDSIELVKLSYANTIDEVRIGLQNLSNTEYKYELIHCNLKSEPGKPAHFFAIRHDTNNTTIKESINDMNVILVIRGTKTIADAITDLLCDSQPYKESTFFPTGMAHSYILDSGRHIANQYQPILLNLLNDNNNSNDSRKTIKNINITIYGHSLGAGAGAIAAMELYNLHHPKINVQMIGYGCPAILSKDLAEQCSTYITTFINHSDLVPRLSGISLTNLLYDIIEFDWLPLAQRDVQKVLKDLQARQPIVFNNDAISAIASIVDPILESISSDTQVKSGSIKRIHTELYPPGKCIQIYRTTTCRSDDKHTQQNDEKEHTQSQMISACYVPNWFYSKIDVNQHMIDDHLLSGGYIDAIADLRHRVNKKSNN